MFFLGFTRICREIIDVATYALYPESFFGENFAIRKVFAFSDSGIFTIDADAPFYGCLASSHKELLSEL